MVIATFRPESITMDVNSLRSDELMYELEIRGIDVGDGTVETMRKLLRGARRDTARNAGVEPSIELDFLKLRVSDEIQICTDKLGELSQLIDQYTLRPSANEYRRLNARLQHVLARLSNLKSAGELPDGYASLLDRCLQLIDTLEDTGGDREVLDAPDLHSTNTAFRVTSSMTPFSNETMLGRPLFENLSSRQQASSTPRVESTFIKTVPVARWDLKFSGDLSKLSVTSFLESVEELKIARNVSDEQLFISAVDLFSDSALVWYRAARSRVHSWSQLVERLKNDFLPPDYEDNLWDQIKSRKQGPDEKCSLFIAVMCNLFGRLPKPLSEQKQIKHILRNINPYFATSLALVEINSIDHLSELCKRLEQIKLQNQRNRSSGGVCPDLDINLSYRPAVSKKVHELRSDQPPPTPTIAPISHSRPSVEDVCWNCRQPGHVYRSCKEKERLFCYRCGKPGVTVTNCSVCRCRPKNE